MKVSIILKLKLLPFKLIGIFFYVNSTSQTFKYSLNYFKYVKHADWKNKALIYFKKLQNHWAGTVQSQPFSELAEIH